MNREPTIIHTRTFKELDKNIDAIFDIVASDDEILEITHEGAVDLVSMTRVRYDWLLGIEF